MRIAALYDIHGNLPALEAVLLDVKQAQVDCLVVGGDAVSGPMPSATLDLLQNVTIQTHFIRGNGESEMLNYLATGASNGLTDRADQIAKWVAGKLTSEQQHFLSTWSRTVTLEVKGLGRVLFCHAIPTSDTFVFTRLTSEEKLTDIFSQIDVGTVVCGHTHMQFDRTIGDVRIINAGSVGMPFGQRGAYWLLLDETPKLMRSDYNLTSSAERISHSDYPEVQDFVQNNVLNVPTEEQALEMLTKMEATQNEFR